MPTCGPNPAKLPEVFFVRYEPRRLLVAAALLSPGAELAHRRLCDIYWSTGRFGATSPAAIAEVARTGVAHVPEVLAELARVGWHVRRGRLVNREARDILTKARNVYAGAVRGGQNRHSRAQAQPEASLPEGDLEATASPAGAKLEQLRVRVEKVPETTLTDERSALTAKEGASADPTEHAFMEELRTLFPDRPKAYVREMENWGGWWRNRYRENPAKAKSVLADVRCAVRERRVLKSPGAAAQDLWRRLP